MQNIIYKFELGLINDVRKRYNLEQFVHVASPLLILDKPMDIELALGSV